VRKSSACPALLRCALISTTIIIISSIILILIMSVVDPTVLHGVWGSNAPAGMEKPKNKGFSLAKMMTLNYRKEKQNQNQHQHHNNNMPFMIHCHIGKEIKHICSNCSRGSHARQDGEERVRSCAHLALAVSLHVYSHVCASDDGRRVALRSPRTRSRVLLLLYINY